MNRNRDRSWVIIFHHHVMASLNPVEVKAQILQRSNDLFALESWKSCHSPDTDEILQFG